MGNSFTMTTKVITRTPSNIILLSVRHVIAEFFYFLYDTLKFRTHRLEYYRITFWVDIFFLQTCSKCKVFQILNLSGAIASCES